MSTTPITRWDVEADLVRAIEASDEASDAYAEYDIDAVIDDLGGWEAAAIADHDAIWAAAAKHARPLRDRIDALLGGSANFGLTSGGTLVAHVYGREVAVQVHRSWLRDCCDWQPQLIYVAAHVYDPQATVCTQCEGCGHQWSPPEASGRPNTTDDLRALIVAAVAADAEQIAIETSMITDRLKRDLREALATVADSDYAAAVAEVGRDEADSWFGIWPDTSEEPGVYRAADGSLRAWACIGPWSSGGIHSDAYFDPQPLVITEADL